MFNAEFVTLASLQKVPSGLFFFLFSVIPFFFSACNNKAISYIHTPMHDHCLCFHLCEITRCVTEIKKKVKHVNSIKKPEREREGEREREKEREREGERERERRRERKREREKEREKERERGERERERERYLLASLILPSLLPSSIIHCRRFHLFLL